MYVRNITDTRTRRYAACATSRPRSTTCGTLPAPRIYPRSAAQRSAHVNTRTRTHASTHARTHARTHTRTHVCTPALDACKEHDRFVEPELDSGKLVEPPAVRAVLTSASAASCPSFDGFCALWSFQSYMSVYMPGIRISIMRCCPSDPPILAGTLVA